MIKEGDGVVALLRLGPVGFRFPGAHPLVKQRGCDLVNIQHALCLRFTLVVDVEKIHELPFHRAVFRFCGFVTVRVGGSGLLAGNELVEGFFDQLGCDGIVGFPGPLS